MKRMPRKLSLARETLRALDGADLKGAGAGGTRNLCFETDLCHTIMCSEAYTICCPPTENPWECETVPTACI